MPARTSPDAQRAACNNYRTVPRESAMPPHSLDTAFNPDLTVATLIVRDGRMLLVEELVHGRLVINQPAGHLEHGESLQQAAIRETLEETGWEVEPTAFVGCYQWTSPSDGRTFVRFAFVARALQHHPERSLDDGIVRALWLTPDELAACAERHRSPLVAAVVDDFLSGQRLPLHAVQRLP